MSIFRLKTGMAINRLTLPGNLLSLRWAIILLFGELIGGTLMYILLENYSLTEAFYMTIITISTVGFTEVEPLSPLGRTFTSLFILINIGVFAYVLSVFTYYIIEGQIFRNMLQKRIQSRIAKLEDHVILCGYGRYGREITENLLHHNEKLVIIEQKSEKIEAMADDDKALLFIEGDATRDDVLQEAGIERARVVICALADDADNLFITLTARQISADMIIVSRAVEPRSQRKLKLAGADHIIMPEQIGGFYMATLVTKPGAIEFFGFMANEYQSDIAFEEVRYDALPEALRDKPIRELYLRRETGVNIIGYRQASGKYQVNPGPDTTLLPDESFIVLGTKQQVASLRQLLGVSDS